MTVPPEGITAAIGAVRGRYAASPSDERDNRIAFVRGDVLTALEAAAPLITAAADAEAERWKLNARRMALLAEAFVYEPRRITEGGLIAQIHRVLTDQDVEWLDDAP